MSNYSHLYVPKNLDVVITSFGGVGTTFLIHFVSGYRDVNNIIDKDDLKHAPYPPVSIYPRQKFVYIFGDPVAATISFFRRNIHSPQSRKIRKATPGFFNTMERHMTLEQYASHGADLFGFRQHFYNWFNSDIYNPVLFVRYETLFDNLEAIFDFLDIPLTEIKNFPPYIPRKSNADDLDPETFKKLKEIYQTFSDELLRLPDIHIKEQQNATYTDKIVNVSFYYIAFLLVKQSNVKKKLGSYFMK